MEEFTIKDVGKPARRMSKNEFIMRHGYQLSIAVMNQPFIESATLLDYDGSISTTITKD